MHGTHLNMPNMHLHPRARHGPPCGLMPPPPPTHTHGPAACTLPARFSSLLNNARAPGSPGTQRPVPSKQDRQTVMLVANLPEVDGAGRGREDVPGLDAGPMTPSPRSCRCWAPRWAWGPGREAPAGPSGAAGSASPSPLRPGPQSHLSLHTTGRVMRGVRCGLGDWVRGVRRMHVQGEESGLRPAPVQPDGCSGQSPELGALRRPWEEGLGAPTSEEVPGGGGLQWGLRDGQGQAGSSGVRLGVLGVSSGGSPSSCGTRGAGPPLPTHAP